MKRKGRISSKFGYWYRYLCLWLWDLFLALSPARWAIVVSYSQHRERLDTYLRRYWPWKRRGELGLYIKQGAIRVNFWSVQPTYRVRKGDVIAISSNSLEPIRVSPIESGDPVPILYEDRYLLIVNKPVGLVVHHHFHPHQVSVITHLLAHNKILLAPYLDMASNVVHRLDKYTSGVLVVSRNYKYTKQIQHLFHKRQVYKEYRALVHGLVSPGRGIINLPIRKDEHVYPSRMVVDVNYHRYAVTEYEVLQRSDDFSYCKVLLHTGRTHQIRVHFAHLNHPVLGDLKYSPLEQKEWWLNQLPKIAETIPTRLMLHAHCVQFQHPFSGEVITVQAPLPSEFDCFTHSE